MHSLFTAKTTYIEFYSQVGRFSTTVLSAMLAGMDDKEDPDDLITMEAMSGLAKIFDQIDEKHVRPILINIALRIRPCFEKVITLVCQLSNVHWLVHYCGFSQDCFKILMQICMMLP